MRPSVLVPTLALALALCPPVSAQRVLTAGAGVIVETAPHDAAERGDVHPLLRVGMEWGKGGTALGVHGMGSWVGGVLADDLRLHVGGLAVLRAPAGALLRLGVGLGLATVVQIDLPPDDGPPGDALVAVGREMTGDVLAGIGWAVPLSPRWSVLPAAELWVQRASARTLRSVVLSVGLRRHLGS